MKKSAIRVVARTLTIMLEALQENSNATLVSPTEQRPELLVESAKLIRKAYGLLYDWMDAN